MPPQSQRARGPDGRVRVASMQSILAHHRGPAFHELELLCEYPIESFNPSELAWLFLLIRHVARLARIVLFALSNPIRSKP